MGVFDFVSHASNGKASRFVHRNGGVQLHLFHSNKIYHIIFANGEKIYSLDRSPKFEVKELFNEWYICPIIVCCAYDISLVNISIWSPQSVRVVRVCISFWSKTEDKDTCAPIYRRGGTLRWIIIIIFLSMPIVLQSSSTLLFLLLHQTILSGPSLDSSQLNLKPSSPYL